MLGTLDNEEMNNLLTAQALGRIACISKGRPYIVPVTYAYDGKYIYAQTNKGRKLDAMRINNNVCFEAERMMNMTNWESVIIEGKFEELKGRLAEKARAVLLDAVFSLATSSTVHPFEHEVNTELDDSNRIKTVMYRIRIRKMTGRYEKG